MGGLWHCFTHINLILPLHPIIYPIIYLIIYTIYIPYYDIFQFIYHIDSHSRYLINSHLLINQQKSLARTMRIFPMNIWPWNKCATTEACPLAAAWNMTVRLERRSRRDFALIYGDFIGILLGFNHSTWVFHGDFVGIYLGFTSGCIDFLDGWGFIGDFIEIYWDLMWDSGELHPSGCSICCWDGV